MSNALVVVVLSRAPQTLSIHVDVGSRFPALISASGRCYAALSGLPESELAEKFSTLQWENPPDYDVVWSEQRAKLQAISAVCREAGCNKVLIRGGKTQVKLTTSDIFELGSEIAKLRLRVAMVELHDASWKDETFLKMVASNRGSLVQFFDNEEEAREWLGV